MIRTFTVLAVASMAFGAAPSAVAEEPAAVELWDGLTTATTKKEVKQYKSDLPNKRVEVIPGCLAPLGYRSKKGTLVTVIFAAQDKQADCHRRLLAKYLDAFGEPEIKGTTFGSVLGYGVGGMLDTTAEGTMFVWREGEKKTKLVKTPGNGYNLIFTVRPDKYIY